MEPTIFNGINQFAFIIFVIGIICIIIEMFTRELGIPAAVAFILFIIGTVKQAKTIMQAAVMISIICGIFAYLLYIASHFYSAQRHSKTNRLSLRQQIIMGLVGKTGKTVTVLCPAGTVEIGLRRYNVQAAGNFIHMGANIKVVTVDKMKIIVEEYNNRLPDS